jgi:hypothetical protein
LRTQVEGGASKYWRLDTAVTCARAHWHSFVLVDSACIALSFAVPVVWFWLLWKRRAKLHPQGPRNTTAPSSSSAGGGGGGSAGYQSVEALRSRQAEDADLAPYVADEYPKSTKCVFFE